MIAPMSFVGLLALFLGAWSFHAFGGTLQAAAPPNSDPATSANLCETAFRQFRDGQFERARELFRQGADGGDSECMRMLGIMHLKGLGVSQDSQAALKWFKSAALTNRVALYNLAEMYWFGDGVEKDVQRAADLFRRSADSGFPPAQYRLGEFYLKQRDRDLNDEASAINWFKESAKNGVEQAKVYLAQAYASGVGVSRNLAECRRLLEEAAGNGAADAQADLGALYLKGEGVAQDISRAAELLQKAAARNRPIAQFNLAALYANGSGVPRDETEAYKLFVLAAAGGVKEAADVRAQLDVALPFSTIIGGIERARMHRAKNPLRIYSEDPQLCRGLEP